MIIPAARLHAKRLTVKFFGHGISGISFLPGNVKILVFVGFRKFRVFVARNSGSFVVLNLLNSSWEFEMRNFSVRERYKGHRVSNELVEQNFEFLKVALNSCKFFLGKEVRLKSEEKCVNHISNDF